MADNCLFLPQLAVDTWLADGKARLVDDELRLEPQGFGLRLRSALHFKAEVAEGQDPHDLVGRVKTLDAVAAMDGEHFADSVVLGDNAYEVEEGFLAEPMAEFAPTDDGNHPDPLTRLLMEL